ncbi:CGNR zinc finger domain-containing protein [Saccharopolyspora gregorii]|uniref:CGNR zinc finger domain-containing protein n=1 Tax=Saccharopolyspora gregorii TaxID=33914 RepID=A0ABP6RRL3_9PSEU
MLDGQHDPAIRTAVDLANTVKPITGADELETVQQLADFLDRHAPAAPGPRHPTRADLAEVRALRGTVRAVLERASTDAAGTAALINDGLRRSRATPALRHEQGRWWTETTSDTDRCAAHLAATTLSALAAVIAAHGPARLGACAGLRCRAVFVDLSRNGSKRYCTRNCAHRAGVAAYRSRQGRG